MEISGGLVFRQDEMNGFLGLVVVHQHRVYSPTTGDRFGPVACTQVPVDRELEGSHVVSGEGRDLVDKTRGQDVVDDSASDEEGERINQSRVVEDQIIHTSDQRNETLLDVGVS
jgi:hypothetical protein